MKNKLYKKITSDKIIKFFIFILVISFLSLSVFSKFDVSLKTIRGVIGENQTARYVLFIHNLDNKTDYFDLDLKDDVSKWSLITDPITHYINEYGIEIKPNDTSITTIYLKPKFKDVGLFRIPFSVKSKNSNEIKILYLPLEMSSSYKPKSTYLPSVKVDIDMPKLIDPRKTNYIKVTLNNKNPAKTNISILIKSRLFTYQKKVLLMPLQQKDILFKIDIDKKTKPQTIDTTVFVNAGKYNLRIYRDFIKIKPYVDILTEIRKNKTFFRKDVVYNFKNIGNNATTFDFYYDTNSIKRIFTKTQPKTKTININNKLKYKWIIHLEPDEEVSIEVHENYVLLYVFILIFFIVLVIYYLIRSPLMIEKTARLIEKNNKKFIRVNIIIRNKSSKDILNVELKDRIPKFGILVNKFDLGTKQPDSIVKTKKGTLLKWSFDAFEGFEERIITYDIELKVNIIGNIVLPFAILKFKHRINHKLLSKTPIIRLEEDK